MSRLGTVVVGGGSGFIGSALIQSLQRKGYEVMVVSRKPGPWSITWEDLSRSGLPKHCIGVVSMAGQNLLDPTRRWTPGFKQNVWASRVNTTQYLADAIRKAEVKPKVFVGISGVGYYPTGSSVNYTEESAGGDFDFLSRLCTDWEAAGQLPDLPAVRTVTIRSGVVLGRKGGMIRQLFVPFYLGLGGPVGAGTQAMPWIHLHDIVGLFEHALERDDVTGVMNGVAPQVITNQQFAKAFGGALWRPAFIPLPTFVLNILFSKERAKIMTDGQKVLPTKAISTDYNYKYPDINSACKEFSKLIY